MECKISEYKGNPVLSLFSPQDPEGKWPFSFGLSKAKMILDNLEEIKKFVSQRMPVVTTGGDGK